MSPYDARIGGIRAGLMGTPMPNTYAPTAAPNPFGPQQVPGQPPNPAPAPGFHVPTVGGNGPISNADDYLSGGFEMARTNIGQNGAGASGFKDRGTMSGQGSPY